MNRWKKSPFPTGQKRSEIWPIDTENVDPWSGEESVEIEGSFEAWKAKTGGTDLKIFHELDRSFREKKKQLLREGSPARLLHPEAEALGLKTNPFYDHHRLLPGDKRLTDELLGGIAEDMIPDIGLYAAERVFGPFGDLAFEKKELRMLAGAVLCFGGSLEHGVTAAGRHGHRKPKPNKSVLGSLAALARTPTCIWRIEADRSATPLISLSKRYKPEGPVANLPETEFMVSRILFTHDGPVACCVLPLARIDPKPVQWRLLLEWMDLQRHSSRLFWEDLLRYRGELLYRSSCEWGWTNCRKEVQECW